LLHDIQNRNEFMTVWYKFPLIYWPKELVKVSLRSYTNKFYMQYLIYEIALTPDDISCFLVGKMAANIMNTKEPPLLYGSLNGNAYTEWQSQNRNLFFNSSEKVIGWENFENRLAQITECMKFEQRNMNNDQLRCQKKKVFFPNCSWP